MRLISMGWGVQSWTLAAMSALGDLPTVDAVVHADTGYEREATYDFAKAWTPWLEEYGIKVITVSSGLFVSSDGVFIPAYTVSESGKKGMLRRSCSQRWKVAPMRKWVRSELASQGLKPTPGVVELWLGVSLDEAQRVKISDVKYISNRWPLLEREMTRKDCITWLEDHSLEIPPKSACVMCPYHTPAVWEEMSFQGGSDWYRALELDRIVRDSRPGFKTYLSRKLQPLMIDQSLMEVHDGIQTT